MRSSPAKASVICVPIEAIWTIGIAISPVNSTYWIMSPIDIVLFTMAWPPT